jgi:hypothetical protein
MGGVAVYIAGDVRVEEREDPKIMDHLIDCDLYLRTGPAALPRHDH